MTTTTLTVVMTSITQSSLGFSSLIFMMKINNFGIKPSKLWTRFKKHLQSYLTKTLIMMTKSVVITKRVALPIMVQTETSSKTTTKRIVRMRSMQKESLGIIVVLRGIMAKIIKSGGTIG